MPVIQHEPGLFGVSDHLKRLSDSGDPLEVLGQVVDFESFRPLLVEALAYKDGSKGGRPHFDPVAMFKAAILQTQHSLSDARTEFMIRDRLSWLRFLGFELGSPTPDENTIRGFRDRLTNAGAFEALFQAFDSQLREAGYLPIGGQIVDASLVSAPKQRNTNAEKAAIKEGKTGNEIWPDEPNKAAQKDTDARWTIKMGGKRRFDAAGKPLPDIAIPTFGYKSHISVDRRFGFIRGQATTSAAKHDGAMLGQVLANNTASDVWADTAYRSRKNEAMLERRGLRSRIHRKKPKGKAMSDTMRRANSVKSKVRARVEHVFAYQKNCFGLFIRTIGIDRARAKITMANLAYNMNRYVFHQKRSV